MRGPKPPIIALQPAERDVLERLVRRHTTPQQLALRARIVLAAAAGANPSQIARQEQVNRDTVRLWRSRWLGLQAIPLTDRAIEERLLDAPRPGKPVRITDEQVCQMVALAGEAPDQCGRPISQWSGRAIADAIKRRGIVDELSGRHAARLVQRGRCSRTAGATG